MMTIFVLLDKNSVVCCVYGFMIEELRSEQVDNDRPHVYSIHLQL